MILLPPSSILFPYTTLFRSAINLFNGDYKLDKKITPVITPKVKRSLDKQQKLKVQLVPKLTRIYKPVCIVFD